MGDRYTIDEAINRMAVVQAGSLDPDKITLEYLFKLLGKVDRWRDSIKEAIQQWPDSANL